MRNITAEVWTDCSDNLMSLLEYPACFTNSLESEMKNYNVNSKRPHFNPNSSRSPCEFDGFLREFGHFAKKSSKRMAI